MKKLVKSPHGAGGEFVMMSLPISYFSAQTDRLVDHLRRYVEIESPSTDKAAVDRFGAAVAADLRELGARVVTDPQPGAGDHLIGYFDSASGESKSIVILCHLDTVHNIGSLARNPTRIQDGKFFGPGAIDMKGSIVITLAAIRALIEQRQMPNHSIVALFTSDEETGSDSSRALIERLAAESALTLCMEPALRDGSLKTARKGIGGFEIVVQGRATHAGTDHEGGVNAIEEMAHHILAIQRLTDYRKGTTVNVGLVGGGTRSNVVPDQCKAEVDVRIVTPQEADIVTQTLFALKPINPKASLTVTGGLNRPPMPRTDIIGQAFATAQQIGAGLGLSFGEGSTGGGSDANFVAPLGGPVLDGLGPMGNGAHSEREHVIISSLPERAALLAGLLREWPQ